MAFTPATGDTSIGKERASETIRPPRGVTPLTGRTATSGRTRTGRSLLTFNQPNVPRPEGTAPPPDVASEGRRITGRQGSTGNPIGDAIGNAAKKLAPLIAGAFQPDTLGGRGGMTSGQHAAFSDMGNEIAIPAAAPAPAPAPTFFPTTSTASPTTGFLKDGGFIRRRG